MFFRAFANEAPFGHRPGGYLGSQFLGYPLPRAVDRSGIPPGDTRVPIRVETAALRDLVRDQTHGQYGGSPCLACQASLFGGGALPEINEALSVGDNKLAVRTCVLSALRKEDTGHGGERGRGGAGQ